MAALWLIALVLQAGVWPALTRTDGRGVVCAYTYDDWLRAATNTHTGSLAEHNLTTIWKFDARGLLTNVTESFASTNTGPSVAVRRAYNAYGLMTSELIYTNNLLASSASQSWDSAGRRYGVGLPGFGFAFTWRPDGLLASTLGHTGGGTYSYNDAGLLVTRTLGPKVTTITSRDGVGRPLGIGSTISGNGTLDESLTYTGDGRISTHTITRPDFTDDRSYTYAELTRRLVDERLNLDATKRWTNTFVYDAGQAAGPGVLTKAGAGTTNLAQWSGVVDGLSRMTNETNNVIRRLANGRVNGPATITALLDGQPMPVTVVGTGNPTWTNQWRATLELSPGAHQLTATARHPSGQFTTNTTIWFTNTASAPDRVALTYDPIGQVTRRVWRSANGTTNRTQTLSWDARGRLYKVVERDNQTNGFDWTPVYDPFGRRLRTLEIPVTNGVSLTAQTLVIDQSFDPQVRFMALGVSVGGKTTWRLMGPDMNGRYGGLQGRGGFDAIIPGPELFCPTINDARGNILAVYDVTHGSLTWNQSRPTGYGSVPSYRPPPLGRGADLIQASAFAGIWSDVTGYYWRGHRYYDPIAGRSLSADPLGHDGGPNLFTYADGDPINFDDPDGLLARAMYQDKLDSVYGLAQGVFDAVIGMAQGANTLGALMNPANILTGSYQMQNDVIGQGAAHGQQMLDSAAQEVGARNDNMTFVANAFAGEVGANLLTMLVGGGGAQGANRPAQLVARELETFAETIRPPPLPVSPPPLPAAVARTGLNPTEINFSQRTVSANVRQYADDMAAGNWDWSRSGPLRITERDGQWVSYDNRRLMAAQQAGLGEVPVQVVQPGELMPGSSLTWEQAFTRRFTDPRNVQAGGVVPNPGLPTQPSIAPPRR
jgi:RHS repeat-associated protein